MNGRGTGFVLVCALCLVACNSPSTEWAKATASNTVAAYRGYLSRYPNDVHAADAKGRIALLEDLQAWTTAQTASSVAGYRQYLSVEPNGDHAQAAREKIQYAERAAAWQAVQRDATADSLQQFLQKYPAGAEADRAREELKRIAGYRAEFGTASTQRAAEQKRQALAKRFARTLPSVVVLEPGTKSPDYRIASGPMSEQDANAACASVARAGQACKVVQTAG